MEENDIMELEYDYKKHHTRHETAFKMLEKWILKKKMFNPPPNLGQLRDGLGITLVVSPWKVHYNTDESREINQACIAKLGRAMTYDRKFIARFVGLLEREICCIKEDHRYEVIEEKACQILVKWRSMESNSEKKAYSKLHGQCNTLYT